jgi:hypothetical protein
MSIQLWTRTAGDREPGAFEPEADLSDAMSAEKGEHVLSTDSEFANDVG